MAICLLFGYGGTQGRYFIQKLAYGNVPQTRIANISHLYCNELDSLGSSDCKILIASVKCGLMALVFAGSVLAQGFRHFCTLLHRIHVADREVARHSTPSVHERNISSFFYYFLPLFLNFFLIFFLNLVLCLDDSPTWKGPDYATGSLNELQR